MRIRRTYENNDGEHLENNEVAGEAGRWIVLKRGKLALHEYKPLKGPRNRSTYTRHGGEKKLEDCTKCPNWQLNY